MHDCHSAAAPLDLRLHRALCRETSRRGTGLAFGSVAGTGSERQPVLACCDANSEVHLFPVPALDKQAFLLGHAMSVLSAVSVAPEDDLIATGDREGRIRISEFPVAPLIRGVAFLHDRYITSLTWIATAAAFSKPPAALPDRLLLSTAADGRAALWDVQGEAPVLLGHTSVVPALTPGGQAPAVTVAAGASSASGPADSEVEAVTRASGAKQRPLTVFTYCSHPITACATQGADVVVAVYGVPQALVFRLEYNPTGAGTADPGAAEDADAVTFAFQGRVLLPAPVAALAPAVEQGTFLALDCQGAVHALTGGDSPALCADHAGAAALCSAVTETGVDVAAAGKAAEKVLPSPLDLAFAVGGVKNVKGAAAAIQATAEAAAAAAAAEATGSGAAGQ